MFRRMCLVLFFALTVFSGEKATAGMTPDEQKAVDMMRVCLTAIKEARLSQGLPIDREADPHGTGILGEEFSPLATSLGHAADKRTAADPRFAAAVLRYFKELGLQSGDVVAIGASGSYPGYILATLCAVEVLGLRPLVVYSYGASMYGGTLPSFTFPVMLQRLHEKGLLPGSSVLAVSMGGRGDQMRETLMHENAEAFVRDLAMKSGLPFIDESALADSIQTRLRIYETAGKEHPVRVFVNIGGSGANYGYCDEALKLPPGLLLSCDAIPEKPERGLIFEFLSRGVPVVHLLYTKGLCELNGIEYDSAP